MQTVTEFLSKLANQGFKISYLDDELNCYAPKGLLTDEIKEGIEKFKPEIVRLLKDKDKSAAKKASLDKKRHLKQEKFPLSVGEKGLYILQKLHPDMSAYNVPLCFKVGAEIDLKILGRAWAYVLEQYPILAAKISEQDGVLYHDFVDFDGIAIQDEAIDFSDESETVQFLRAHAKQPFDLSAGPLTRIHLFLHPKQGSILLITVHHIIFDGSSAVILLKSLFDYYQKLCRGERIDITQAGVGYHEFVEWEKSMLESSEGQSHADYWSQQLSGNLPSFQLTPDVTRQASAGYEGETLTENIPRELSSWVRDFSRAQSLQASVFFLGVFQILLHKYTSHEDVIVGMPVLGRASERFANEVGYFINMVPIRTQFGGELKLHDFFRKLQGTMLDALYHSSYPFPLMLEKSSSKQVEGNPIFQVSYAYQNFIQQSDFKSLLEQQKVGIEAVEGIYQEGDFDLNLELFEGEANFKAHLKYNPNVYTEDTMRCLFQRYCILLKEISLNPDLFLHEYSIVTKEEKNQLIVGFNQTQKDYPKEKCLHQIFSEQVANTPNTIAASYGEETLSYQELYDKSHGLALYLQSLGVKPDSLVGLCMERSLDMMVAIMGVLQAGGAYIPLDADYPDDRLTYMLEDSRASIVLTQESLLAKLTSLAPETTQLIPLDEQEGSGLRSAVEKLNAKNTVLQNIVKPNNLAYVIYTSGSTGKPKGVMIEHMGAVNHCYAMIDAFVIRENDAIAQTAVISFDISVWQTITALLVGARVAIVHTDITRDPVLLFEETEKQNISVLQIVPSLLRGLTYSPKNSLPKLSSLRWLSITGEAFPTDLYDWWVERYPGIALMNAYGPAECSDDATLYPMIKQN